MKLWSAWRLSRRCFSGVWRRGHSGTKTSPWRWSELEASSQQRDSSTRPPVRCTAALAQNDNTACLASASHFSHTGWFVLGDEAGDRAGGDGERRREIHLPWSTAAGEVTVLRADDDLVGTRSEEHTSELQSHSDLVC